MAGNDAIAAQVLSLCTIVPHFCLYESSTNGFRRLVNHGDRELQVERIPERHMNRGSEYRSLQQTKSNAQITAVIFLMSSDSQTFDTAKTRFQTNSLQTILQQTNPSLFGTITVGNPSILLNNNNNNNLSNGSDSKGVGIVSSTAEFTLEQIGLIALCVGWFGGLLVYLRNILTNSKKRTKIQPTTRSEEDASNVPSNVVHNDLSPVRSTGGALSGVVCPRCFTPCIDGANYCSKCGELLFKR
jgi:hypothetical protein